MLRVSASIRFLAAAPLAPRAPGGLTPARPSHRAAHSGAAEPIALGLFAFIVLSSSRVDEHALCGWLVVALLCIRLIWAMWLGVIASIDWRRYHAPAVLALPTVSEIMAKTSNSESGSTVEHMSLPRDTSCSPRVWMLVGLVPLNVELLQWIPWRASPHDGLPNYGMLAITTALSLSQCASLLLLQAWFLATGGIASAEYGRAAALGVAAILTIGSLCRVGLRRAVLLSRLLPQPKVPVSQQLQPSPLQQQQPVPAVFVKLPSADMQRTPVAELSAAPASCDVSQSTPPRLISTLSGSDREAALSSSLARQAAARTRIEARKARRMTRPQANSAALERARDRVRRIAAAEEACNASTEGGSQAVGSDRPLDTSDVGVEMDDASSSEAKVVRQPPATPDVQALRVTRAKSTNISRRINRRMSRARATNEEARERAAEHETIRREASFAEQWRPSGLTTLPPNASSSTLAADDDCRSSDCSAQHRLQHARAANRVRRSRAASAGSSGELARTSAPPNCET